MNTVYMWGEFGRLVTNNTIDGKKKQYPSHYDDTKVKYLKSLVGKNYYAYDCAGLIKSYFMSDYGNLTTWLPRSVVCCEEVKTTNKKEIKTKAGEIKEVAFMDRNIVTTTDGKKYMKQAYQG